MWVIFITVLKDSAGELIYLRSIQVVEDKRFSLVKPTVNTPFHIDFEWWRQNDRVMAGLFTQLFAH